MSIIVRRRWHRRRREFGVLHHFFSRWLLVVARYVWSFSCERCDAIVQVGVTEGLGAVVDGELSRGAPPQHVPLAELCEEARAFAVCFQGGWGVANDGDEMHDADDYG